MKQEFLSEEEDISKEVLGITLSTMKAPQNIISETVSGISELYPNSTIVISMNDRAGPELWETANHVATQISDSVSVCVTTNTKYESSVIPPENIFRHTLEGDRSALIYLNGFQVCLRNPMIEKIVEIDLGGSMNWQQIPEFIKALILNCDDLEFSNQIDEETPKKVLDKLLKIPYFTQAYFEDGLTEDGFKNHLSLVATAKQFSNRTLDMVNFVSARLEKRN